MYISPEDKNKILLASESKLVEVIEDYSTLHKSGVSYVTECPCCGADRTLTITPGKKVFKCFRCNELSGKTPLEYLMKGHGKTFVEALHILAKKFNIFLEEPVLVNKSKKVTKTSKPGTKYRGSYCEKMLKESGLDKSDILAKVYHSNDSASIFEMQTFSNGTIDQFGSIIEGDDVIIKYYDLDGFPVTYQEKDGKGRLTNRQKTYYRVRWQYPEEHKDKEGKPFKYKSPSGSSTFIYIPERLRAAFKAKQKIERLFIQEGEKKAEKASKHGLLSVGISGIQNLGTAGRLPEDLIRIIQVCGVKEVVFILDADWNDLSQNLKISDRVDKRPRAFFSAVKNYKEYMRTLKNRDIFVEIYFGHVLKNEKWDKGVDDLLTNTLQDVEDNLKKDIDYLINEKDLLGEYIQLYKISTWEDPKLLRLWGLDSPKSFVEIHKDVLKDLPEFRFGRHKWRINEAGELESAQPIEADEQFWEEKERKDRYGVVQGSSFEFRYVRARRFLQNRGFGRYLRLDGSFQFIHLAPPTVRTVEHWEVRDFLFEFAEANCNEEVNEMIARGGTQYFGPDKLSQLAFIAPNFQLPVRDKQMFYFDDKTWEITADNITQVDYSGISHHIWSEQKKSLPAKLTDRLIIVEKEGDKFRYEITKLGQLCHFLKFLENTSDFTWRKMDLKKSDPEIVIHEDEIYENTEHLIAKLCSIGYLLLECKDQSTAKAIVAMDGKQSEVGSSQGRSGKSIIGELMKRVYPTVYINGKKSDLATDNFLWDELTEKTKTVFIDDVRPGFDFESLFANITGDWAVNYKGGRRCTIPFTTSPKIYITTNHALNGEGSSFKDRQWLVAFSDFYNEQHKPLDDFGIRFFDEWDFEQWNLTWNLLAQCVQLYLKYGVVQSPGERLEQRQLRQAMGEEFLSWAEEYFSDPEKRNTQLIRKDLYEAYLQDYPDQRKWTKPTLFKKKIIKFCEWKGWRFNPHRYDTVTGLPMFYDKDGKPEISDKSGGVERFTIGDENFHSSGMDLNADLFSDEGKELVF